LLAWPNARGCARLCVVRAARRRECRGAVVSGRDAGAGRPARGRLPAQLQKSMLASGSAVAPQNSVTLPPRTWLTLATGIWIDLPPRSTSASWSQARFGFLVPALRGGRPAGAGCAVDPRIGLRPELGRMRTCLRGAFGVTCSCLASPPRLCLWRLSRSCLPTLRARRPWSGGWGKVSTGNCWPATMR